MAKTLKRIDAGPLHDAILYNRCSPGDSDRLRSEKKKASSAAQAMLNRKNSYRKLEYMLAANFPANGSAIFGTLTYNDEYRPADRKGAMRQFKYFLQRLREERRRAGLPDPVVFWAPEILTSISGHWHFHFVMDNTGQDFDMIRSCWIYGKDEELEKMHIDELDNYERLAKYITKEARECQDYISKPGLHGWSHTRNARKPEVDTVTVPDDYVLEIPSDAYSIKNFQSDIISATYQYIKYIDGSAYSPPGVRTARRKKKN